MCRNLRQDQACMWGSSNVDGKSKTSNSSELDIWKNDLSFLFFSHHYMGLSTYLLYFSIYDTSVRCFKCAIMGIYVLERRVFFLINFLTTVVIYVKVDIIMTKRRLGLMMWELLNCGGPWHTLILRYTIFLSSHNKCLSPDRNDRNVCCNVWQLLMWYIIIRLPLITSISSC